MKSILIALAAGLMIAAAPDDSRQPPDVVTLSPDQQHTINLRTARAERRPITEPVRVPGTIAFDQGHVAVLRPLAMARIVKILVQPDDTVQPGQPVATLEIPSLVTAQEDLATAGATEQQADAGVAVARDALRRGEILARDGSLSRAEVERRQLMLTEAQASAASARIRIKALQTAVDRLNPRTDPGTGQLVSPIGGIVTNMGVTPGEQLDTTTNAFTIADLSVVVALAQVPEGSAAMLNVGDQGQVHISSAPGRTWQGKVAAIGASLDPQARTLPVRITLDNPDHALRAGMFVEVTITTDRGREDITIPSAAVQFLGDKRVAFTPLGDNKFQSHILTLGVQQPNWTEVQHGLNAGDEVVTDGSFTLRSLLQEAMLGGGN